MKKISWKDDFYIGNIEFDNQHKKLLTIINKLFDDHTYATYTELVIDVYSELIDFIDKHLKHEEMLLKLYDYPDLENHIQKHNELIQELSVQTKKSITQKIISPEELLHFFAQWFEDHISHDALALRPFFKEKGNRF